MIAEYAAQNASQNSLVMEERVRSIRLLGRIDIPGLLMHERDGACFLEFMHAAGDKSCSKQHQKKAGEREEIFKVQFDQALEERNAEKSSRQDASNGSEAILTWHCGIGGGEKYNRLDSFAQY